MECLGCMKIETHPVTLIDGRVVCSSCEDWRAECEAREVLNMRTLIERRTYLDAVEGRRGKQATDELRALIAALWEKRKAA